jgi:hypothetical protein
VAVIVAPPAAGDPANSGGMEEEEEMVSAVLAAGYISTTSSTENAISTQSWICVHLFIHIPHYKKNPHLCIFAKMALQGFCELRSNTLDIRQKPTPTCTNYGSFD